MPGMGPMGVPMIPGGPGPWGPGGPGMPMAPPQQWGGERRSRSRSPNRYGGGADDGGGGYHGGEVDPLDAYMDGIQQEVTKQKKKDKKAGKVDKSRKGEDDLNIAYVRDQYGAKAYDMYRRTGKKFDPASIDEGLEDH